MGHCALSNCALSKTWSRGQASRLLQYAYSSSERWIGLGGLELHQVTAAFEHLAGINLGDGFVER